RRAPDVRFGPEGLLALLLNLAVQLADLVSGDELGPALRYAFDFDQLLCERFRPAARAEGADDPLLDAVEVLGADGLDQVHALARELGYRFLGHACSADRVHGNDRRELPLDRLGGEEI